VLAGQGTAALALTAALVAVQMPLALHRTSISSVVPLIVCTMWLATFLAGWLALMLFLGTALEGKANAVAMIAVLFLPLALSAGPIDRLPRLAVTIIRGTLLLLPQVDQMTAMFRAILGRSTPPRAAPFVLLASPFFYFALASIRLHRIQPAGRLTQ